MNNMPDDPQRRRLLRAGTLCTLAAGLASAAKEATRPVRAAKKRGRAMKLRLLRQGFGELNDKLSLARFGAASPRFGACGEWCA